MKFRSIIIVAFIAYLPLQGMAWGLLGHRIIGQVAESYLNSTAKREVYKILGTTSIAMSSNWADFIKSDPDYNYLYNWHFINFNGGLTKEKFKSYLDADTATDAYTKINFLAAELKNKVLDKETQLLYLRMLIHLVGDVHQPLHVGRLQDRGGNRIKVLWFSDSSNLHQVWDEKLINFQQLSYTEYTAAINHVTRAQKREWMSEPVSTWLWNSYQYAEKIYADIKKPDQRLDYKYNYEYLEILNRQLLMGGVHLAALLNDIFSN